VNTEKEINPLVPSMLILLVLGTLSYGVYEWHKVGGHIGQQDYHIYGNGTVNLRHRHPELDIRLGDMCLQRGDIDGAEASYSCIAYPKHEQYIYPEPVETYQQYPQQAYWVRLARQRMAVAEAEKARLKKLGIPDPDEERIKRERREEEIESAQIKEQIRRQWQAQAELSRQARKQDALNAQKPLVQIRQ